MILGIESTAHTFGIGLFDGSAITSIRDIYRPAHGRGIHPSEAAAHHREVAATVLEEAVSQADVSWENIDAIAYSAGPGLPPCLKAGMEFAQDLSRQHGKPLIPVNHCIAHIEIGRFLTGAADPVTLYVSGGNTQVIGFAAGRYRVFGETQDISIGNAIDTFIREKTGKYPGGPVCRTL
jgi:glycoprotease/Kae1 family metallohydrolase